MFIKHFKQINKNDVGIAGGKGASLGEMVQADMPVPPGFVILVDVFDRFMEETDLGVEIASIIKNINYKDINSVDKASNQIRDLFHDVAMPKDLKKNFLAEFKKLKAKYVAVRSSATAEDSLVASWAGELETYLNTTEETLIDNIKKCWSSLFTPRALFYAFEKGVFTINHQKKIRAQTCKKLRDCYPVNVAVVIQKMVQSDIAGICFTVHPVTEDRNQMVIEAGYGLGEAVVSGQITPDTYVVGKSSSTSLRGRSPKQSRGVPVGSPRSSRAAGFARDDLRIMDKNISKQERMIGRAKNGGVEWRSVPTDKQARQKLTDRQIGALAKMCQKIEKHYKHPQDIEWALEKDKFYITQSRPITTL